jgi:P27 family predicted phage terminase small subunit
MRGRKNKPDTKVIQFKNEDGLAPDERHAMEAEKLKPSDLEGGVAEVWDRIVPHLSFIGRLQPHYVDVLVEYCMAVARMKELRAVLKAEGEVYESKGGRNGHQFKSRPELAQLNETFRQWRSLTAMLGLSPADERGLATSQGDLFDNEFAALEGNGK